MRKSALILGVSILSLSMAACSITSIADKFKDPEQLASELHESPRFLYDTIPAAGYDNVSVLSNEFFKGKPYNNIVNFGDNILLIAQGSYNDNSTEQENTSGSQTTETGNTEDWGDADGDYEGEPSFEYSFDVYSPWSNSIIGSLSREEVKCDYYQVTSDRLLLFDSADLTVATYDLELNPIGTYSYKDIDAKASLSFFEGKNGSLYSTSFTDDTILKINPEDFSYTSFDSKLYEPSIISSSKDGKYMLMSGVTKDTLKYTVQAVNTDNFEPISSFNILSSEGTISDQAFVTPYDTVYDEWLYQRIYGSSIYFSMPDIRDVNILPDGTALIHQEKYYDEGDNSNHKINFYQMDKNGKCINDFKFTCPSDGKDNYTYFAYNYVYLEDCNSVMFLVYTADVNPYILVWDLNAKHKCTSKIKSSTDSEKCIAKKKNKKAPVTLIKDPDNYNWGTLNSANIKATELEKKYGIEIYLGPEVPKEIDVFKCKQTTDPYVLNEAIDHLSKILECYPDNFFNQLCFGDIKGIRIYLAGDLSGDGKENIKDPSGYVCNQDNYQVMVLDSTYYWDWDDTVNHELSHMIDRRLDFLSTYKTDTVYSEDKWNSFNPKGFEYLSNYIGYENNPLYNEHPNYFINDYGVTFPTEDRAQIFGAAMEGHLGSLYNESLSDKDSPLNKKLTYYCQAIRDGFNTTGWKDKMAWEDLIK